MARALGQVVTDEAAVTLSSPLEIATVLVISTAHITRATALKLEEFEIEAAFTRSDGWVLHVGDKATDAPADLEAALAFARAQGCTWLMLDCDGPLVVGLESWSW